MNLFKQPFPHHVTWQSLLKTAFGFGAFIAVFLLVFRPFDLDTVGRTLLVKSSIIFGLVTFTCVFISNLFILVLFPGIFNEEKWTTGKQILNMGAVVMLVGLVNYLISPLLFDVKLTMYNAIWYQVIALSVGFLPIVIYILINQNRWLKQFQAEATILQKKLQEKKQHEQDALKAPASVQEKTVSFESDNQKEKIAVNIQQLLYIESASNYIKIYFEKNGKPAYGIVRMTMKRAIDTLEQYSIFFRCHRAYIVNLEKIEEIEGNAQGYKLKIKDSEDRIPVSRNLNDEFSDRLLANRNKFDD